MTYSSHDDAIRTSVRRVSIDKVDDTNATQDADGQPITQQLVDVSGFEGDSPKNVVRLQPHGFHSNPPEGSEGLLIASGGRSDRGHVLVGDHQDHRPKNVPSGDVAMYNHKSFLLQTAGDDFNLGATGTGTLKLKSLVIQSGGVTVTIDANGLTITGGAVKHDGHDIGKTHQHKDTQPGGGLSGVPQ